MNPIILVVDDDGAILHAMQGLLERCGYEVLAATSVPEAQAAVEATPPDLIVMDLVLPGMDGRAGAQLLREVRPDLRFLYISGYTNEETMRMEQMDGYDAFLRKPFSAEELLGAIERVLDGRDWDEASLA
jgi:CheY-like chemotaxis protein